MSGGTGPVGRGVAEMKINARGSPWADFDGADLVYWIAQGRSNKEIVRILSITSENRQNTLSTSLTGSMWTSEHRPFRVRKVWAS